MASGSSHNADDDSDDDWATIINDQNSRVDHIIENVMFRAVELSLQQANHSVRARRRYIERIREKGHEIVFEQYFLENPIYPPEMFRTRYQMRKPLFERIMNKLVATDEFFQQRNDATGMSAIQKCIAAMRVLTYGSSADLHDEYLRMSAQLIRKSVIKFVEGVISNFGGEYLRKPTEEDISTLLQVGERRGFPGMLGNISLLSKLYYKYNDSWITDPSLEFRNHSSTLPAFFNFVSGALPLWKGSKILRFSISFILHERFYSRIASDLDSWLRFAVDKQLEELYLNLTDSLDLTYCRNRDVYSPNHLYSCSSIRKLSLVSCKLYISENVQWDHLQSLIIEGGSLSSLVMVKIIFSSPQLEVLNLLILETSENLTMKSTSLKILKISRFRKVTEYDAYYFSDGYNYKVPILEIWAPNLETLELVGYSYGSYSLNVPSLTNAVLDTHYYYSWYHRFHHIQYYTEYDLYPMEEIVQFLRSICHAEKVTLSDWCIEALLLKKKMNSMLL